MTNHIEIKKFWDNQALLYGASSVATMPDQFLKNLEVENVLKYLKDGMNVVDIGCGNGYSTFQYANAFDIKIKGIDYSESMINIAQKTLSESYDQIKEKISFMVGDVKETGLDNSSLDTVITDRCLINLTTRDDQALAIKEIHRVLKLDGLFLMCEDTEQGLKNLNSIRGHMGLDLIRVRWHNLYLDEDHITSITKNNFDLVEVVRFSSLYYLASRIIHAKIVKEQGREPDYNNEINRVAAQFSSLSCFGDFGPLKLFIFRKI